jgi:hypothetical protein
MNKTLDFRFNGKLNSEISYLFNKISNENRANFNEFVALISRPHTFNLDWWTEGPASRNTYSSPLFHYYCVLNLIIHLDKEFFFTFNEIIVDSPPFVLITEQLLNNLNIENCKVSLEKNFKASIKKYFKRHLLTFFLLFRKLFQMFAAYIYSSHKLTNQPIVLIDTFIMPYYVNNDRWYGALWDNLTNKQKLTTFFVPTLTRSKFKDIFSLYKEANLSTRNYIFKESFLQFKDLVFVFGHKKRINKIKFNNIMVQGYDFSDLIKYELNNNSDINATFESIFTYRFIKRFKQAGFKVRLSIDWFEGQCLDKAWNMGFKKYYPLVKTIGYRPYESFPLYLCTFPILIEQEAQIIPDIIALQGKGTEITVKEFMPNLETILIPSFKSSYVWDFKRNDSSQRISSVTLALPISEKHSKLIIERIIRSASLALIKNEAIKFLIKPHPAQSINKIMVGLAELPSYISFTEEKSFVKLLFSTHLLITEASSVCLEAMACGIPVIMMENQEGLTYDSIPSRVSKNMFRKVRSDDQLTEAMIYFINANDKISKQLEIDSKKIREDYFEPVTQEGINRLMDISI